jgi:hypothetical protein
MSYSFEKINIPDESERWNSILLNLPDGSYNLAFNPSLADFFSDYYHAKPEYYLAYEQNELVGLLPGIKFRNRFYSMPILPQAGFSLVKETDQAALYREFTDQMKCDFEIRSAFQFSSFFYSGKVNCHLYLQKSADAQMQIFERTLRKDIRKTYKNELEIKIGGMELLDEFYRLYCRNMFRLGSAFPGKDYFVSFFTNYLYGDKKIFVVLKGEKTIGCVIYFTYGKFAEAIWGATLQDYNELKPNTFLIWEMIKYSIESGVAIFSFGRSNVNSPSLAFKKQWGVTVLPLYFNYGKETKNINEKNWFRFIWKKLPFSISAKLGPILRKKTLI